MNIFFLSMIPELCAMWHCDKHVVKMILETAQILSSVHHLTKSEYNPKYKLTHKNHPCNVWTRESLSNYVWLCELGIALCKEYTHRYKKIHSCQALIEELSKNLPVIDDKGFTPPAQAMPDVYKGKDAVEAYRQYYFFEKNHILTWKNREEPSWVSDIKQLFN